MFELRFELGDGGMGPIDFAAGICGRTGAGEPVDDQSQALQDRAHAASSPGSISCLNARYDGEMTALSQRGKRQKKSARDLQAACLGSILAGTSVGPGVGPGTRIRARH